MATYPSAPPLLPPPLSAAAHSAPYEQLLRLSDPSVQMCAVSAEGSVSVPSYPTYLEINAFSGPEGSTFVQLGDWRCPLIPGETPILLTGKKECAVVAIRSSIGSVFFVYGIGQSIFKLDSIISIYFCKLWHPQMHHFFGH